MPVVRFFLLSLSLLCIFSAAVYAFGQQEDERLSQVETLLEQRKLGDAEKLLIEILKTDPAQKQTIRYLLDRLRAMRAEYNKKLNEFMDLLEQGDEEAIYKKIKELEALDSSPSALGKTILEQARENAWVAINLKKFFDIMDNAQAALQAGNYSRAFRIYSEVFELHKDDFYVNAAYGNILKNNIQGITNNINRLLEQFDTALPLVEKRMYDFYSILAQASENKLDQDAGKMRSELNTLLDIYLEVEKAAGRIKQVNDSIKRNYDKAKGDYHLYYLYRVIYGRDYSGQTEGILYALHRQWELYLQDIEQKINQITEPIFYQAKKQFSGREYDAASIRFKKTASLYGWEVKYSLLWMVDLTEEAINKLDENEWARIKPRVPLFLQAKEREKESRAYLQLIAYYNQKNKYVREPPSTDEELESYRSEIRKTVAEVAELSNEWKNHIDDLDDINDKGYAINDVSYSAREMKGEIDEVAALYQDLEKNAIRVLLQARVDLFSETVSSSEENIRQAKNVRQKDNLPTKALQQLEETNTDLTNLITDIDGFVEKWSRSESYISDDRAIREAVADANDIKEKAIKLRNDMQPELALTRKQSYEANQLKTKGLSDYEKAKDSFNRNRFAQAKEQLRSASEALTESLIYEEDPEIRKLVDEELIAFDKEIMERWRNQSIIEVRNLINRAQEAYSRLLFEEAENLLLRAQDLSNEIDPSKQDVEIIIWLDIVRSALTARSSREIKEEEVNYAEMTQLFNLATKDYYDGMEALKINNKERADQLFKNAREKIDLILRSYPYHRDSRVLLYRIEQAVQSEAEFSEYLRVQVKNADQLLERNNYLEAYAVYQDIQEINPRYPGINGKVRRAEELIGIRARQPSQAAQERSNELVRLARESFEAREYQAASGYLEEALRLNPFNKSAAVLKDQINEIVAPPSSILPVAAQQLYNSAVVHYNKKEYLRARQLLSKIKNDFPQHARNAKVIELEEKIRSRIGS
jgi:hypothetical protein